MGVLKTDSIKKNYILNTVFQVFNLIIPLITAPYIARVLGPEGVGIRSYTTSLVSIFIIFAVLGTAVYGQQVIAQCRDDAQKRSDNFWGIVTVSIITNLVTVFCWLCFSLYYNEYHIYLMVLTIRLLAAAFDISWYFAAIERFSVIVYRNIIIKIVTVVLILTLVKQSDDLLRYLLIEGIGILLCNITMWIPLLKTIQKTSVKALNLGFHFKNTLVYFLPTIASSVYSYVDKTMIGIITRSNAENGYYEQAQAFIHMAFVLVSSLNTVMSSRIAYLFSANLREEIMQKLRVSLRFVMALSFPLSFGLAAISDNFIPWFLGPGYDKVVLLLKLCSPMVILLSIHNYLASQYLVPSGQRARSTIGVVAGAIVNFIFNALLIPYYQSAGAVIASILSECMICAVYLYMSRSFISLYMIIKSMLQPFTASIIMCTFVRLLGKWTSANLLSTVLQILFGGTIYLLILFLVKNELIMEGLDYIKKIF